MIQYHDYQVIIRYPFKYSCNIRHTYKMYILKGKIRHNSLSLMTYPDV